MKAKDAKIERLEAGRIACTVSFSTEERAPAEEKALRELGARVSAKGFRPGKVPQDIVREKVDATALLEETIRHLLPGTFESLIREHGIQPIIHPHVEAVSKDPLTLKVTFVERPEVKVKGAGKITVEKKEPKLEEKDVDRMIEYILRKHKKTHVVERAAKQGDQVTMDFRGEGADGKEIPEIRANGYQVIIGSKTLLPGFEEKLVGLARGQETSFSLTFPEKYHAEHLANKPVTFHVNIRQVEEVEQPKLTDAFAQKELQMDSAQAFREHVRKSMLQQEEDIERKRREQELFDLLRKATVVSLAPELLAEETRALIEEFRSQLAQQNMQLEDWLARQKRKPEEVQKDFEERAKHRLTLRFGIQKLIEERKIAVSEAEMQAAIEALLSPLPEEKKQEMADAYVPGKNAYEQFKWQKQVEKLIGSFLDA
ncbi:MAG: trigger factor [Candidatus Peribacteraceae bacterium]|nr:trigger factor [Candidatus Peribacteraceae bacterium]